ncbi:MAG: SAM-dependent methyltransferase [Alteromonadaceae bacterium]|nr:SAM-dependent methyltransferase [Alteromonadaceae bacterium]MBH87437.1 SAM-dependent methyltransferase [Alteromonadaceae bacterium]
MMKSSRTPIDYNEQREEFETWFQSPLGRALLADQRRKVEWVTREFTGAHQLLVSVSHRLPIATTTDFSMRMMTTPRWAANLSDGVVVSDAAELPFPSESMDLVVLHHTHDFAEQPHQVVREATRVLRSSGHLIIIGFNPIGLWGIRKLISRRRHAPWGGRFVSPGRVEDWLNLLDCELGDVCRGFHRPPIRKAHALDRLGFMERLFNRLPLPGGAYYCISAEKRVLARTETRRRWRKQAKQPVAMPVAGSVSALRPHRHSTKDSQQERHS